MNKNTSKKEIALGIVGLLVIVGFAYWLLSWISGVFSTLNPTVAVGILAASATILVSVTSALLSKRLEYQASIRKEIGKERFRFMKN